MSTESPNFLFTIVMDWNGGTYIGQVRAGTSRAAISRWAKELDVREIPGFGESSRQSLLEDLGSDPPVLLEGRVNVWCATALVRGKLALVNIVRTES